MRFAAFILLSCLFYTGFSQALPDGTMIPMELTEDVSVFKYKQGASVPFVVSQDVKIDGKVVIPAQAKVRAVVTISKKPAPHEGGELRVDIYDVMAMDGTTVKLADCWIFTTAAQNYNGKGALLRKGTRKNCNTVRATN